jgi:uncharacterized SAM-binding protein YcdF (DUF218 family)
LFRFKQTRWSRILSVAAIALLSWELVAWIAGRALITNAEIDHADAIVVLANAGAYVERTDHAAQLWREGRAPRVILTNENLISGWSEALQRNPYFYERATDQLKRSGVPADRIEVLPSPVDGTLDEAVLLRQYAVQNRLQSLLIVTSAYHSRRALWIFRNVFEGSGVSVGLDAVPPGQQTPIPAGWWLRPRGWRTVALEYPKFAYYWWRLRTSAHL